MAQDKQLSRIEAKLDALLDAAGIELTDDMLVGQAPPKSRELTPAEKQAIANAPKHIPAKGPGLAQRTHPVTNAPVTPTPPAPSNPPDVNDGEPDDSPDPDDDAPPDDADPAALVPPDAVGAVTVETEETDGDVKVETIPPNKSGKPGAQRTR